MKDQKDVSGLVVFFVFVGIITTVILLGFGIYKFIYYPISDMGREQKLFCINNGFNKSTDFKYHHMINNQDWIEIECDNSEIIVANVERVCIKKDKWGDCNKKELRITNSWGHS